MRTDVAWWVLLTTATMLPCSARQVTLTTDAARLDVAGNPIDAHDGKIVAHNGTYFLYGESYGNQTLLEPYPWKQWYAAARWPAPAPWTQQPAPC